ncbi:hypothetical protein EH165_02230 [Nakamurella antarctica]|uniref:Rv3660c-like CheY-like N-terminal domain-containing protein n=1 Tax=Nakamurella antarctica TaxID=1902245 RepID=A0A3G8ZIC1_9ACTN|nr:septum site-determining protein Ssd [Nakamurella antarctica]AZI57152.1 hypothetical protein EH165_02230 [Nakamurella antarctica]
MEHRPLVITEDPSLLDDLLRVAAAAGVEVAHATAPTSKTVWRAAPMVVIDAAAIRFAIASGMPRRPGVVVVSHDELAAPIWEQCVVLGVERTLVLPMDEEALVAAVADALERGPDDGPLVAFIGGRGGAGASVLAAAVAVAGLKTGKSVLLADCDQWGAGLDLLLGIEAASGVRWDDLAAPSGRVPVEALHSALPCVPGITQRRSLRMAGPAPLRGVLSVLAHNRDLEVNVSPDVLDVVLDASRRAGELAVVDLPRTPDPVSDRALQRADAVILVTPADLASCFAARRLLNRISRHNTEIAVVVRGPAPGGLGADDVAEVLGLPLVCQMRPQPNLARDLEQGRLPGSDARSPLGRAAAQVLVHLDQIVGQRR